LDVSKNVALEFFSCWNNQLTTLDVSNNTGLIFLDCDSNQLSTLDVSKNNALRELDCRNNQLTALDVSRNSMLEYLWCQNNQLVALNVSGNTALTALDCRLNLMESADDVIGWQSLGLVLGDSFLFNPQKTSMVLGTFLQEFPDPFFRAEVLWRLNWDGKNRADETMMDWNDLRELASITYLGFVDWDIADMTGLKYLSGLRELWCAYNSRLTSLDVSQNTMLEYLYCYGNRLTELNVSQNTALIALACDSNLLTSLDVSQNTSLSYLNCSYNYLKSTADVIGWQEIGLILDDTFMFHPQNPGEPPTGKDITASFTDAGFLAAVRDIIGKPSGPVLDYDVAAIQRLYLDSWNIPYTIYDLSGIEH
jgi:Leucine-rich repeat (LRR) protein